MKKTLLFAAFLLFSFQLSFGWGSVGHKAVAQVAENHISKSTKKAIKKYLHGATIVEVASDADKFYYQWSRDIGWECSNPRILRRQPSEMDEQPTNIEPWCHSYTVDSLFNTYRHNREGDVYVRNCVMDLDYLIRDLKENRDKMDKQECIMKISVVVHQVGDMHCPMHMRYIDREPSLGTYNVYFGKGNKKRKISYHALWDHRMISAIHPWSYTDMANLFDIYSEKEIAKFCKGDIFTWAEEVAVVSWPMREYGEDDEIDEIEYRKKYQQLGEELLTKAGYRLAKVLNDILK